MSQVGNYIGWHVVVAGKRGYCCRLNLVVQQFLYVSKNVRPKTCHIVVVETLSGV